MEMQLTCYHDDFSEVWIDEVRLDSSRWILAKKEAYIRTWRGDG